MYANGLKVYLSIAANTNICVSRLIYFKEYYNLVSLHIREEIKNA